jgi:nickel superoxide dismutase
VKSRILLLWVFAVCLMLPSPGLRAHCEIPCGIYNDELRITLLREHCDTIEKSMKMIAELSAADEINYNQLVRWVNNKEDHANELQHIVTQYFMTQRVKPAAGSDESAQKSYTAQLSLLHRMLVSAMKAKQTIDPAHVEELRKLIAEFAGLYFVKE